MKKRDESSEMKIAADYGENKMYEISVEWNGYSFLVIYGKHINGWFAAIPNWNVCAEIADPSDIYYNLEKISEAFSNANRGIAVANAIKEHWEGMQK